MGLQLLETLLLHQRDTNQLLLRDSLRTLTKMVSLIQSARLLLFMPLLLQLLPMLLLPQLSITLLPQLLPMLLLQLLSRLLKSRPLLPQLLHMLLLSPCPCCCHSPSCSTCWIPSPPPGPSCSPGFRPEARDPPHHPARHQPCPSCWSYPRRPCPSCCSSCCCCPSCCCPRRCCC